MSQMQEIRSFYLDSQWTQRNANGSFSLLLDEQIEVPNGNVMYLDEVSVIGSIPMVNLNNSKLYVVEQTPRAFDFAQTIVALDALVGTPGRTSAHRSLTHVLWFMRSAAPCTWYEFVPFGSNPAEHSAPLHVMLPLGAVAPSEADPGHEIVRVCCT